MFQRVSIQFLITNGDIENPIEALPFTSDGACRGPFVETSFHVLQAVFRSDRCQRRMPEAMTAGEVVSDSRMAGQDVILQTSFWSRAIDAGTS